MGQPDIAQRWGVQVSYHGSQRCGTTISAPPTTIGQVV